ncbi:MAG: class I SAM-dependent methyltransferase [Nitrospinota bacterium]
MLNYRQRLYKHYITTHFSSIRDTSIEACERHRRFFRAYFGPFLPADKNAAILDIGCGFGSFLYFLKKEGYRDVFGVDISPEQVEVARGLGINNAHCEDLEVFLQKHTGEFDCIAALDVIEHIGKEELFPILDAVQQALKPGGIFIMQAPNGASPLCGAIRYADFTHELAFTKESVGQVLRVAGFADIRVYPTGPVVHGLLSACRWVLWQGIQILLRLYLAAEAGVFGGYVLTQNLIAVARKPGSMGASP